MINVEPILDIIETTLWTGMLKSEKPLSVMLIAGVGAGKSEILRKSYKPPRVIEEWKEKKDKEGKVIKAKITIVKQVGTVLYTTDSTPFVLTNKYGDALKKQVKHIVIPDFLSILTKNKEAMPDTIRFYNALIEEGICRIESRYSEFVTEIPLQVGLITAISSQDYEKRSKTQNWGAMGFLSRILPVSFRYTDNTKGQIRHSTFKREYHHEVNFKLPFPPKPVYVEVPDEYEKSIDRLALQTCDVSDEAGARRMKQLMSLIMACALKHGRDEVNDDDMKTLLSYSKFLNSECKVEL